jgi:hypothetical protein
MIYNKTNAVGIDYEIQLYQQFLYTKLKVLWNISDSDYDSYDRAYRNNTDKGYIPEFFNNTVLDSSLNATVYKTIIFDETLNKVVSFFNLIDTTEHKLGFMSSKISFIMMINLQKIKTTIAWRPDEEVKIDVLKTWQSAIKKLHTGKYGAEVLGIETGIKNVFKEFDGLIGNKEFTTFNDRHPLYCFKINLNLNYNIHFGT